MKTVLCFGDSNTWGSPPEPGPRYDIHTRWPGVLREALGEGFHVIEEGLGGRTTIHDDPVEGGAIKNGLRYLPACIASHRPLDFFVLMLGTNDLKKRFNLSAEEIAAGARQLAETVLHSSCGPSDMAPQVILLAPPPIVTGEAFGGMFCGGKEKSLRFANAFGDVAEQLGCEFLDAGQVIVTSELDGIHIAAEEHAKLGRAVCDKILALTA